MANAPARSVSHNDCPVFDLLIRSPYPLKVSDIAMALQIDELTAAMVLREYRHAGLAKQNGNGWIIG